MLDQLFDRLQWQVLFVFEGFDDGASLGEDIVLNESLVRVLRVPLLANRHFHYGVELLLVLVWVWKLFHPVLLRELLVTFLRLVDLHATQLSILPLLFDLVDLASTCLFSFLLSSFVLAGVDAFSGPFVPPATDLDLLNLGTDLVLNVSLLFLFKFLYGVLLLGHK
jgi:hypothetical protein